MRTVVVGLCLIAVGVVLEGCGGGGSSTCLNSQLDLVSQSLTGTVMGSSSSSFNKTNLPSQDINADITEKMDFEKWNYAASGSMPVTSKLPNGTALDMKVEFKAVFMADQKMMVEYHKITDNKKGTVTANCTKKTFANMPTPAVLTTEFAMIKKIMQQKATCGGNDGTDDTWNVDQKYDGPVPPIPNLPVPAGTTADVTFALKLKMDKNSLIHGGSVNMQAQGSATGMGSIDVKENSELKISEAKAGGPVDADLDFSGWGDCKPMAAGDSDIEMLSASVFASIRNGMVFQSHLLATVQACLKAQQTSTVVV